ncbi:hypothetical protein J7S33_31610 [Saccharothrix algeriensis]|uniref:Uncharacterized protein n=1 Tax=Saccharothrix algeriensis TaxID=173560 RepID=A0A8T8HXU3_9PSEU|nr:hypothetical protein [Saccharothrix algeriensis]QTR03405.1 hypothetical protein J7S33_31610 [Saccharothrix algeriensis]
MPDGGRPSEPGAPGVRCAERAVGGVRLPRDVPVEDFLSGFSMVTLPPRGRESA